ncbi:MAG: transketolase family protein [Clostridia bacterium]|nr:transketolase family protein [Clostridia bacterium]MDE6472512.1 transketolase family protein [Clostridia bacterium]
MQDSLELREVYCNSLVEEAKTNDKIVVVEADLMNCIKTGAFKKAYPDRFFNVGIAEANMVGVSAGLATCGKIPFCSSFGTFATRRCYDQIFISVAYSKQNVKIVGTDPGICAEINGGTHMPFEDMGIMRGIPNMLCVEPTDATMLKALMPQIIAYDGATYIRMQRKKAETVYQEGETFDLLKAKSVVNGKDATIIASGIMVSKAIEASKIFKGMGMSVGVLNVFTWKPIDEQAIIKVAKSTGALVVAENHNIRNGLYSAVAEVVVNNCPVPMESVGVQDEFGEVGKMPYLAQRFHLTVDDIVQKTLKAIKRKK